jgi:hypothetical protein
MKRHLTLANTSLAMILLLSFHMTDDALRPSRALTWESGPGVLIAIMILFLFLLSTVNLAERRSGYVVALILSVGSAAMPVLHLQNGVDWSRNARPWFFLWTLIALGVLGLYSTVLCVAALRKGESRHGEG